MGAILVAMPKHDDSDRIARIIKHSDIWEEVISCDTGSEVLRRVEDMDISLIVCGRRLKDMGYEELYGYLPSNVNMLLLSKDMNMEMFSGNIIILQVPFRQSDLINSIRMLDPACYRRREKKPPQRSATDRQTIDEAKRLLMDRNSMTEPEAYRYLQKNSMDMGRTLTETARMILALSSE